LGFCRLKYLAALLSIISMPAFLAGCVLPFRVPFTDKIPLKNQSNTAKQVLSKHAPQISSGTTPFSEDPFKVTLSEAVLIGLANNKQLQVDRIEPAKVSTYEQEEVAIFDPILLAEVERNRQRTDRYTQQEEFKATSKVSKFFPTGTTVGAEIGTDWNRSLPNPVTSSDWQSYAQMSMNQALLRGAGVDVNLANLRKAQVETQISLYQLSGLAQTLTLEIEKSYWDYFYALGQIDIYSRSLTLAQRIVRETQQRINAGEKARSEIFFVKAEAATREQSLIDAKSDLEKTRIRLLRLISPPSADLWNRKLQLMSKPVVMNDWIEDLPVHIRLAMQLRPDVNEARLRETRGELELIKTRNGLLPRLDLFVILGGSGYSASFGDSVNNIGSKGLEYVLRGQLEIPIGNNKAVAQFNRSRFTVQQEREAIDNLLQLAQQDILLAYVEVHRARDQMRAAATTLKFQLEKRDAEMEKFRLGTSSAYAVAQTERDAVNSEVSALRARIDYLKGLAQFYFAEGTLLARRGLGLM
jgi:outer membrane protein